MSFASSIFGFGHHIYTTCIKILLSVLLSRTPKARQLSFENVLSAIFFGPKMDRFIMSDFKSAKSGSNAQSDEEHDSTKQRTAFQKSWMEEFPLLVLNSEWGVMKYTNNCSYKWPKRGKRNVLPECLSRDFAKCSGVDINCSTTSRWNS